LIDNRVRIKKFVEGIIALPTFVEGQDFIISLDEINSICVSSEYLPHNHSDVYFFISLLINFGVLERVRKGNYFFKTIKGSEFL
jgi:hypothetical protein